MAVISSLTRRRLIEIFVAAGGTLAMAPLFELFAADAPRTETANMVLGPFYPMIKPADQDTDLTTVQGHRLHAAGEVIEVSGRIVNRRGDPVRNARVEIWQANTHGRYNHQSDPNTSAELDPDFQGYALLHTNDEGQYRFRTIKPGPYPARDGSWMRAPHIHFDIQGRIDRKVTQMFFPGERLNEQDRLLQGVRRDRETLISTVIPSRSELLVKWDIVLAEG